MLFFTPHAEVVRSHSAAITVCIQTAVSGTLAGSGRTIRKPATADREFRCW
jgi:hypothetical protein